MGLLCEYVEVLESKRKKVKEGILENISERSVFAVCVVLILVKRRE